MQLRFKGLHRKVMYSHSLICFIPRTRLGCQKLLLCSFGLPHKSLRGAEVLHFLLRLFFLGYLWIGRF